MWKIKNQLWIKMHHACSLISCLWLYQHLQSPLTWLEQARWARVLITGSIIWNLPGRDVDSTSVTAFLHGVVISDWPLCHQRQTVFKAIHPFFTQM